MGERGAAARLPRQAVRHPRRRRLQPHRRRPRHRRLPPPRHRRPGPPHPRLDLVRPREEHRMRVNFTVNGRRQEADDVWEGESLLYV
ncbi:hypothetical protein ACFTZG_31175, partial [Streptomyces albidoflavus]